MVLLLVIGAAGDLWRAHHVRRVELSAAAERSPGPGPARPAAAPATGAVAAPAARLDLNTADERALDGLPGIGPVLAARIVQHRREHGPFRDPDELLAVRGIGPRLLERLRPLVAASAPQRTR